MAIISALSIVLTEAISNSAVVAMLMPVTLGVANDFAMDPRVMALVVAVPAGLGFTMPIGTPANAIAYSSGYLSMRDMMVPGFILAVSSWAVFNLVARLFWPLLGILARGRVLTSSWPRAPCWGWPVRVAFARHHSTPFPLPLALDTLLRPPPARRSRPT